MGEAESEQSCDEERPGCGGSYELMATGRAEGWYVSVTAFGRLAGGGLLGARDPSLARLPPVWKYPYRVALDRGDGDWFFDRGEGLNRHRRSDLLFPSVSPSTR